MLKNDLRVDYLNKLGLFFLVLALLIATVKPITTTEVTAAMMIVFVMVVKINYKLGRKYRRDL